MSDRSQILLVNGPPVVRGFNFFSSPVGLSPLAVDLLTGIGYYKTPGEDGEFAPLAGSGGSGNVSSFGFTNANGISGVVTNATTTPNLTLSLGAITPSSVAATGTINGSNLSGTNTGDQTITLTGDVTGSGTGSFAATLANTAVTPGSYTYGSFTVDAKGRLTAASSGTAPTGTVTSVAMTVPSFLSIAGSPVTTSGTLALTYSGTPLPIANGGTGTASPGLIQGSNVTITGSWPNQTINASAPGTGTVTTVSVVNANGVSGSVANPTTTPAITLTLGAITPTSVAATGAMSGSNLSGTNTGDQTNITGNSGTATALQTGRTIDGITFDGTANILVIAPATHAATSKATPVDADEMPLADSAASFVLKKLTWANLKAALKTYFDTLYKKVDAVTTLTDAATITVDASLSDNFRVTLGGNRTLDNPSNLTSGQVLNFRLIQDGTGSRTLAYSSKYKFAGGIAPILTTTASAKDFMSCQYDSTDDTLFCVTNKAFA